MREWVERARRVPIEEVLRARGIEVHRRGRLLVALCPFHRETEPSFTVYPDHYHCFGCGAHGDVISLVMRLDGVGFRDAVRILVEGWGFRPLPEPEAEVPHPASHREPGPSPRAIKALAAALEAYHRALLGNRAALNYTLKRISLGTVREMKLGYAPPGLLWKLIREGKMAREAAEEAGLIVERKGRQMELFRRRIIIPEIRGGEVIHLSGRLLRGKGPKYLFLPGPKPIYGWERVQGRRAVFITEGLFDWLALVEWGYPAVCLLGTWIKREHIPLFDRFEAVYVVMDADRAGKEASRELRELWDNVEIIALPPGVKDVNELYQHPGGKEIFRRLVGV